VEIVTEIILIIKMEKSLDGINAFKEVKFLKAEIVIQVL
jgi:hypothetical protein